MCSECNGHQQMEAEVTKPAPEWWMVPVPENDATDYVKALFEGLTASGDRLRASRDTRAIERSTAVTRDLMTALRGHL